jgi:hypothetical protein
VDPFDEPAGPDAGRLQPRRYDRPMCESIPRTAAVVERYTPQPINPAYQADGDPAAVLAQRWPLGGPLGPLRLTGSAPRRSRRSGQEASASRAKVQLAQSQHGQSVVGVGHVVARGNDDHAHRQQDALGRSQLGKAGTQWVGVNSYAAGAVYISLPHRVAARRAEVSVTARRTQ